MVEEVVEPEAVDDTSSEQIQPEAHVTGAAATSHDLSYVEGIGEVYSGKLRETGVDTPQALLERGATPQGRKELAETTGISATLILEWVNHVDLFRIKGVGSEYADLLEEAGVDTVVELAQRNPANLFEKLSEVNAEKSLVRKLPTAAEVEDWVSQAKDLPRMISY
jgi:predicted flap endonuclease-1-like 5' DNA nuclease